MTARHEDAPTEVRAHIASSTSQYISPEHLATLKASAISDEAIAARPYRTVADRAELRRLGFSEAQARPGLLIPAHSPTGEVVLHQLRPDNPRQNDKGKAVKYETPAGAQMRLDVPPICRADIGNPAVPLFITEGIKKGDSLASHGLCAVALLGVWNWCGTNEHGGKVALGEWRDIALNGREVAIAYDSDVMVKPAVATALRELTEFLKSRRAHVKHIYLPDGPNDEKLGADDFLGAGHTVKELVELAEPPREASGVTQGRSARAGGDAILDAPTEVPALWGHGQDVLHARGEALMLFGPDGVGKTTLAQQYLLGLMGRRDSLLGLPITPIAGTILSLSMDRPQQAIRSLRRMVDETDRAVLNERLRIWEGPLPFDLRDDPLAIVPFVREQAGDCGAVFVDSIKDAVVAISEDKSGSAWNMARQHLIANRIEVVELHHPRKQQQGGPPPRSLADVYGSRWLTAGAGSVVCLWGNAGDPIVDLTHLKPPAAEVGPFKVTHDHETGTSALYGARDLLDVLRAHPKGATAPDLARQFFDKDTPSNAEVEKVRRRLRGLEGRKLAHEEPAKTGGAGGSAPARWFAVSTHDVTHAPLFDQAPTGHPRSPRLAEAQVQESTHESTHATHAPEHPRFPPSLRGGNGADDDFHCHQCGADVETFDPAGQPVCMLHAPVEAVAS